MQTREDAIAHLESLGFHAGEWDTLSPGAMFVMTRGVDTPGGGYINLGRMVVIYPSGAFWELKGPPEVMRVRSEIEPAVYQSLEEAVRAAAAHVAAGGGPIPGQPFA